MKACGHVHHSAYSQSTRRSRFELSAFLRKRHGITRHVTLARDARSMRILGGNSTAQLMLIVHEQAKNEISDRMTRHSLAISKCLCLLGAAFPSAAVSGWSLMEHRPVWGLLLAAIVILFTPDNRTSRTRSLVACALAVIVSVVGLLHFSTQTAVSFAMLGAAL